MIETYLPDDSVLVNLLDHEGSDVVNGRNRVIISFRLLKLNLLHVDDIFFKFYKPYYLKTCS